MLSRWKRDAIPMEARCYPDTEKEKGYLAAALSPFLVGIGSVLDTFPAGLFFALATGFNFGTLDDMQAFQLAQSIR